MALYISNPSIRTYEEAKAFFATARNKIKGKPLRSWALLKQDGDDYVVVMKHWTNYGNSEIGRFKPDNTFIFTMDIPTARMYSTTLSQALYGALPFWWNRVGMGRYEIASTLETEKVFYATNTNDSYRQVYPTLKSLAVPYHGGLRFDLATNKPLNAQLSNTEVIVPEKRKEWLRALKVFKRNLYTKAKLGIIEGVIDEVYLERGRVNRDQWVRPDWYAKMWGERLYTAVKNNDTSTEMIKLFAQSARYYTYRKLETSDVTSEIESVLREQSITLRKHFGVFG